MLATFATTASAEAKLLVRYDVSGGLAGLNTRLTINTDRTAKQTGNRVGSHRYKLSSKQLRALRRTLKAARFSSLKHSYKPDHLVFDGLTRTATYKGRSVSVSTGATYPARLHALLDRLGRLRR